MISGSNVYVRQGKSNGSGLFETLNELSNTFLGLLRTYLSLFKGDIRMVG